jgi:hypothetical protein
MVELSRIHADPVSGSYAMASAEKEHKTATAGIKDRKGQNAGQAKLGGGAQRRPMFEQMTRDAARISCIELSS